FPKTPGGDIPPEVVKAAGDPVSEDHNPAEAETDRQQNPDPTSPGNPKRHATGDLSKHRDDAPEASPSQSGTRQTKAAFDTRHRESWGQFGYGLKSKAFTKASGPDEPNVLNEEIPEPEGFATEIFTPPSSSTSSLSAGPESPAPESPAPDSSAPDSSATESPAPDSSATESPAPDSQSSDDLAPEKTAATDPVSVPASEPEAQSQADEPTQPVKSTKPQILTGFSFSSFKMGQKGKKATSDPAPTPESAVSVGSFDQPKTEGIKPTTLTREPINEEAIAAGPDFGEQAGQAQDYTTPSPTPTLSEVTTPDRLAEDAPSQAPASQAPASQTPASQASARLALEAQAYEAASLSFQTESQELPSTSVPESSPLEALVVAPPEAGAESLAENGGEPLAGALSGQDVPKVDDLDARAGRPNFLTSTRFSDFDLPSEIMMGIEAAGFDCCTPIQAQVIPVAMEGLDIAGQAQTGTGKTTAFLVPILSRLLRRPSANPGLPRALIITPTRELADQIYKDAKLLASATNLTQALVIGGLEYREQTASLEEGSDLVICTPGRLIDYLHQGVFIPTGIEVAVVDEADRLLDMGFNKDLKAILAKLPPYAHRQTMLFSATLDDRVLELTYQYMNPPQYITAEPDPQSKIQIDQCLYHVSNNEKLPLLIGLLRHQDHSRVIIFCNTRNRVDWLTKKLVLNGFQAEGITGDLPQAKRLKLMQAFKEQKLQIMVATDVASRGIHVEDVSHVYNYDLPQDSENYIHRIGRTARAGKTGKAISFACEEHVYHLEAIENLLGEKIPVVWPEDALFDTDKAGYVKFRDRPEPRGGSTRPPRPSQMGLAERQGRPDRPEREGRPERSERQGRSDRLEREGRSERSDREVRESRGDRRIPTQTPRPGGIFGISPRYPIQNGQIDVRQTLSWKPSEFTAEDIKTSRAARAGVRPPRPGRETLSQPQATSSGSQPTPDLPPRPGRVTPAQPQTAITGFQQVPDLPARPSRETPAQPHTAISGFQQVPDLPSDVPPDFEPVDMPMPFPYHLLGPDAQPSAQPEAPLTGSQAGSVQAGAPAGGAETAETAQEERASEREGRRRKRRRGKTGRDSVEANGAQEKPVQSGKRLDRRAQNEAIKRAIIDQPQQAQNGQPLAIYPGDLAKPDRGKHDPHKHEPAKLDPAARRQPEAPSDGTPIPGTGSTGTGSLDTQGHQESPLSYVVKPVVTPSLPPSGQAEAPIEPIDCQLAAEQEYVDSGMVEQHPDTALAPAQAAASQAAAIPADSAKPASAPEAELDFWGFPKTAQKPAEPPVSPVPPIVSEAPKDTPEKPEAESRVAEKAAMKADVEREANLAAIKADVEREANLASMSASELDTYPSSHELGEVIDRILSGATAPLSDGDKEAPGPAVPTESPTEAEATTPALPVVVPTAQIPPVAEPSAEVSPAEVAPSKVAPSEVAPAEATPAAKPGKGRKPKPKPKEAPVAQVAGEPAPAEAQATGKPAAPAEAQATGKPVAPAEAQTPKKAKRSSDLVRLPNLEADKGQPKEPPKAEADKDAVQVKASPKPGPKKPGPKPATKKPAALAPEAKVSETKQPAPKKAQTKRPPAKAPEAKAAELKAPEAKASEPKPLGPKVPEAKAPAEKKPAAKKAQPKKGPAKTPEGKAPEAKDLAGQAPAGQVPADKDPAGQVPAGKAPAGKASGPKAPGPKTSGAKAPEAKKPTTAKPGAKEPKVAAPEAKAAEAKVPGAKKSGRPSKKAKPTGEAS
ncbi:MAG: DEAD/DEAH box helicase, partial [Deltaproteobacteria bacterium]|nr:DEAD/DEAH box helicase [Deltaproteobacteria bacterium]